MGRKNSIFFLLFYDNKIINDKAYHELRKQKKKKCEVWNFENVMHIPIFNSAVKYRRSDNNLKI